MLFSQAALIRHWLFIFTSMITLSKIVLKPVFFLYGQKPTDKELQAMKSITKDLQEYASYLQALVDNAVFTEDMVTSEMATKVSSDIEVMELAIGAEKDSILFYYEMKDLMPQRAQPTVNKIIAEEKSHLRQLSELKRKLAAI